TGAYAYNATFPKNTSSASYLVDVIFQPTPPPLTIASQSPVPGAIDEPAGTAISATFSAALASGYGYTVASGSTTLAATAALSTDGKTLTVTPTQPLPNNAQVTVTLTGLRSTQGATLADTSWTFATADTSANPASYSLFGALVPQTPSNSGDTAGIELGLSFSSSQAGTITGIRFYKGAANTGTHTGSIWSSAGTRLATVTFANETPTGWESATLATPLAISANTTYVVSYYAPNGGYASTPAFFGTAFTRGPLMAPAGANGVYVYGSGGVMPTSSWNSTNYFVDVVFKPAG
uniref:DUF4082 domain-containing protein n=1 Tax=Specibacter cremeus TaxID=1629051 RepID=UPI000F78AB0B